MNHNYFLYFIFVLNSAFLYAESEASEPDIYLNQMVSASVADMVRYGNTEDVNFTGGLNLSIPIYTLPDPDFPVALSMRYHTDGFKPRQQSGYVGSGWRLDIGGCITREVNNYPDEKYQEDSEMPGFYHRGMYSFLQNLNNKPKRDSVFALNIGSTFHNCDWAGVNLGNDCHSNIDYLPDVFHFHFGNYSGKFMINNEGKTVILSGDFIDVDLSGLIDESPLHPCSFPYPTHPKTDSRIIVHTLDGYTYVFGGDLSSVEYNISLISGTQWKPTDCFTYTMETRMTNPPVHTWYLTQIIAPNRRTMSFHYKPSQYQYPHIDDPLFAFNEYYDLFSVFHNSNIGIDTLRNIQCNMTKQCVLDSISISGLQSAHIYFYNSQEAKQLYNHSHYSLSSPNFQLDSIQVVADSHILKRAVLNYVYASYLYQSGLGSHNWRYLSSLHISGEGTYQMHYQQGDYPYLITTPQEYQDKEDLYGYSKLNPSLGMLHQLNFPTGGKQTYEYEPNQYGTKQYYQIYDSVNIQLLSINDANTNTSGMRLKKIQTYDEHSSLVEAKQYAYCRPNTDQSSGIFYNYLMLYLPHSSTGLLIHKTGNYSLLDTHIGYTYIDENITQFPQQNSYKTRYAFFTGDVAYCTADDPDINRLDIGSTNELSVYYQLAGVLFFQRTLIPIGKLLTTRKYQNTLTQQEQTFVYNGYPSEYFSLIPIPTLPIYGCQDTIVVYYCWDRPTARKLYIYPDVMNQYVHKDEQNLLHNQCYQYDTHLRVKRSTTQQSDGKIRFTHYTYPDELIENNHTIDSLSPYYTLTKTYRINTPIEIYSGFIDSNTDFITSGSLNLFTNDSTPPFIPYANQTYKLQTAQPLTHYTPLSLSGLVTSFDSHYKQTCEYKYNQWLQPTMIRPFRQLPTYYIWNGLYPNRKTIGNQTYEYTFIPYVGIHTITNPRGIVTTYNYDSNGRLIEVVQQSGNRKEILNTYQYHTATE